MRLMIENLKRKIFLLLGRGIVKALKTDVGTQLIQVIALDGETITDVERMEEYGFTAVPETGSEASIGFINGNRDQGLILCIGDRRYRPTNLASGEVQVYDKNGSKVHLKSDGSIEIESKNTMLIKAPSGTIVEDPVGITLKTGDAASWAPCGLPFCLWSGAGHGGAAVGIVKLKGQ
jgi:phage baseplate assembly protein V